VRVSGDRLPRSIPVPRPTSDRPVTKLAGCRAPDGPCPASGAHACKMQAYLVVGASAEVLNLDLRITQRRGRMSKRVVDESTADADPSGTSHIPGQAGGRPRLPSQPLRALGARPPRFLVCPADLLGDDSVFHAERILRCCDTGWKASMHSGTSFRNWPPAEVIIRCVYACLRSPVDAALVSATS
jgi:hypothetical protein